MNAAHLARLLQLADSAFPSGAFSHSFGLESAIAEERVHDEATLDAWLRGYLLDGFAPLEGAALALVVRGLGDAQTCDDVVSAATFATEVRSANARIARAILDTLAAMGTLDAALDAYREALLAGRANGVPGIAYGLACASLGIEWEAAFTAVASAVLAALAGVGTRAIPLGQRATARVLWNLRPAIADAAAIAERVGSPDELHAQAFPHEIDAMRHALLDGRLFAS